MKLQNHSSPQLNYEFINLSFREEITHADLRFTGHPFWMHGHSSMLTLVDGLWDIQTHWPVVNFHWDHEASSSQDHKPTLLSISHPISREIIHELLPSGQMCWYIHYKSKMGGKKPLCFKHMISFSRINYFTISLIKLFCWWRDWVLQCLKIYYNLLFIKWVIWTFHFGFFFLKM